MTLTMKLGILQIAARAALSHMERNECRHEETHRGGILWTICDGCDQQWADDEGGFQPYVEPKAIAGLRNALEATA